MSRALRGRASSARGSARAPGDGELASFFLVSGESVKLDATDWRRPTAAAAAVLALALPPTAVSLRLVGPESPLLPSVVGGVWALKAALLLNSILLWLAPRLDTEEGARPLLAADPPGPASGPGDGESTLRLGTVTLIGLLTVALAVRLPELNAGMWFDEIRTLVEYMRMGPGEVLATYDSTNQHILYSLVARASIGWLGESALALRLPAVVFGVGSVWATWWLGRRLTSGREALLAAALLALSYHHVWFSQDARGYTALLFGSLVSTAFLVDMLRSTSLSWRLVGGYGAATALAIYTHPTAGALWIAHASVAGWLMLRSPADETRGARRTATAGLVLAASLTLLLYAPVLPQAVETLTAPTTPGAAVEWENPAWLVAESAAGLARGVPGGLPALAVGAGFFTVGLVSYVRRVPAIAAAMVLPAVLVLAAAVVRTHNLWPRFFFFSAGFGALVLVRGVFAAARPLGERRGRAAATGLTLALVAASAVTVPRAWGPKQDFRAADRFLEEARSPGDAVVALDMTDLPLRRYLGGRYTTLRTGEELSTVEASHRTTWVVYTFPVRLAGVYPELWRRLQEEYRKVAEFPGTVRGGTVVVVKRG